MGKRTSQLNEITTIDNNDILYGVDVDDLTHSPDGTSVKFKKSNLLKEVNSRAGDIESDVSELQGIISGLLDWFYPIGTIYETTSSELNTVAKMNSHFGGTWEVYGAGRVLVAKSTDTEFNTVEKTGGAKTHTLTVAQIPRHNHPQSLGDSGTRSGWASYDWAITTTSRDYAGSDLAQYTGGGQAHNNLPPYIVVYRFRRTA